MDTLKTYGIAHKGLSEGLHTFNFDIDDAFFKAFENEEIQGVDLSCQLTLDVKSTHIALNFEINGWVGLECDRCLEIYKQMVEIEQTIYVKFGESYFEEDENLYILPESDNEIDVAPFINELVVVSLPMKRVHSNDSDDEESQCKIDIQAYINNNNDNGSAIDPRWNELNKLKDGTS